MSDISNLLRPHAAVLDQNGAQVGTVDRLEGERVKLSRDAQGRHHWIPLAWVERVDEYVHLRVPGDQVMKEWQEQ